MRSRRTLAVVLIAAVAGFGAGCGGDDEADQPVRTTESPGATPDGKQLFASNCGRCHTLEAAGTDGQVGPNLDDLSPNEQRVLNAINGGPGAMPENLLEGADARAVAAFVSRNAGK